VLFSYPRLAFQNKGFLLLLLEKAHALPLQCVELSTSDGTRPFFFYLLSVFLSRRVAGGRVPSPKWW